MENEDPDTGRITWPKKVRNGVPDPDLFDRGTGDAEKMTGIYRGSCMVQWKISALPLCYYRYSQGHEDRAKRKGGKEVSIFRDKARIREAIGRSAETDRMIRF